MSKLYYYEYYFIFYNFYGNNISYFYVRFLAKNCLKQEPKGGGERHEPS